MQRISAKRLRKMIRIIIKDPRARLCVVLEGKEFDTNPIVDFLDESFSGRQSWIGKAIFVMNKFDILIDDTRTAVRANKFFEPFFSEWHCPVSLAHANGGP